MPKYTHEEYKNILETKQPNLVLLSNYINSRTHIWVKCLIHNYTYKTKPGNLIRPKYAICCMCAHDVLSESRKLGIDKFIEKAKVIHGDKYDYSKVEYGNINTKVIIICPKHGEFLMSPNKHLNRKQGCAKCAGYYKTTDEFIEQANKIHFNKFDYSKVNYSFHDRKVCIICPEHGEF